MSQKDKTKHMLNLSRVLERFEASIFASKHNLTLHEFTVLYGLAQGFSSFEIMMHLECSRSTLHRIQRTLLTKTGARNKLHIISVFTQTES